MTRETEHQTWDVSAALRVAARFADWLSSPDAARLTRAQVWEAGFMPEELAGETDLAEMAKESNAELAAGIRGQAPIWVDPAMVDLLAAASAEFSPDGFQPWHLPHPSHGLVVLAKPMPADWLGLLDLRSGEDTSHRDEICAITWESPLAGGWLVRSWARSTTTGGLYRFTGAGTIRCPDLRPAAVVEAASTGSTQATGAATRALVALTALSRTSSNVAEVLEPGSKAARKMAARYRMAEPVVRRLYLNRPESGAAELDALRAERAGAPRGHWVRGHWKRQWYAATEEHRWHWIDGYPRGDFEKGAVPGARVQVARPPRADVDEEGPGA
ncbi:hypothetical protein ACFVBP_10615 [Nocardioides sp. NPDC057764]|uniref:hypothetical protein n=1 Tax=Nocardioides sp. NPDC057764 TaxID=3346243 RepID=UPI00366DF316